MKDHKLIEMINSYLDGELERSSESFLFAQLSENDEAREYFKNLSNLKKAVKNSFEEFPEELDTRILKSINSKNSSEIKIFSRQRVFIGFSIAALIILIIFSSYLFFNISSYNKKVEKLSQKVISQSRTIEMLYNSLPGIEVEAILKNAIVIKPNS
jgi:hypothetical protein